MYKGVSGAAIGQLLPCQQKRCNIHDPYAVTVVDRSDIVGHVAQRNLLQIATKPQNL